MALLPELMCHAALEHIADQARFLSALRLWATRKCGSAVVLLTTLSSEFLGRVFTQTPINRTTHTGFRTRVPLGSTGYEVSVTLKTATDMRHLLERCGWQILETIRFETARYPLSLRTEFGVAVG